MLSLKLVLTPLLIAAASLAQRKWGGLAGGLIAGLPLTSAPVSVFLALEHGPAFAAHAAGLDRVTHAWAEAHPTNPATRRQCQRRVG